MTPKQRSNHDCKASGKGRSEVATKSSAGGGKCSAGVPESGCPSRPIVSGTVQIQAEIHAPWAKEQQDSVIAVERPCWKFQLPVPFGGPICVTVPNFAKIGQTVPEIWPIFDFSRWRPPPFWILEISNF